MKKYKILLVGLGSIGKNLAKSLTDKGYNINIWDKDQKKTFALCKDLRIDYKKNILKSIKKKNTIIILAIPAGLAVDSFIQNNTKYFKNKSYIVDIGNSHPKDTISRFNYLKKNKIKYISCGFSGGAHGARTNASLMVSCDVREFNFLKKLFLDIIGKNNKKFLKRIGENPNSGNYTKIVHNGIEYGIMQAIADYYLIMKEVLKLNNDEIIKEFTKLQKMIGNSFLIRITKNIIKESKFKKSLISNILDIVDDNNTGGWAVSLAADCKFPIPAISSSVEARFISRQKRIFKNFKIKNKDKIELLEIKNKMLDVLNLAIIASYLQGIGLLQEIINKKKIKINLKYVLLSWMNNSIIRSDLLKKYYSQIKNNKININSIFKKDFSTTKNKDLLDVLVFLTKSNLALTSISSLFTWTNLLVKKKNISFSLIQKQRNYFGGHKLRFHKG